MWLFLEVKKVHNTRTHSSTLHYASPKSLADKYCTKIIAKWFSHHKLTVVYKRHQ